MAIKIKEKDSEKVAGGWSPDNFKCKKYQKDFAGLTITEDDASTENFINQLDSAKEDNYFCPECDEVMEFEIGYIQ